MGFNKEQQSAIDAPISKNVLVAAGAGSGKTRTLAEKVFTIIDKGEVKPSELLVLTFTDNAAHEMRERIIGNFKDRGKEDIAEQVASAHIQTFDSFARFLVVMYADALGISSNVNLVNSDVISAKKSVYLDEIFDEYYNDDDKREKLVKTLVKFNLDSDRNTKKVIVDLCKQLDKLPLERKEELVNNYEEKFLSDEYFNKVINDLVISSKNIIIDTIKEAYFVEKNHAIIDSDNPELIANLFNDKCAFNVDINLCNFICAVNQEYYQKLKEALRLNGQDFVSKIHEIANDKNFKFSTSKKNPTGDEKDKAVFDVLKGLSKKLDIVMCIEDVDTEINKLKYFKDDISLLLEIVKKLNKKLDDYKRITNSFEFNDILLMAVSLLTNPKYEKEATKIRKQFKFIMVDEYQDTNDFQEAIIDSLLLPKEDGTSAHLFCVGDAKQAIYAFRNSKVELFTNRQKAYSGGEDNQVILMHKNYRSGKKLLNEINHIFKFYMTLSHGGIDYAFTNEGLEYDEEHGPYSKLPYDNFGVSRIVSVSGEDDDSAEDPKMWEAEAIANDIKNKVKNHFKIYKRTKDGGELVDASYGDFVIIMRKGTGFEMYQDVFKRVGVPLNNKFKTNLKEINAILLLQSLVELIVNEMHPMEDSDKAFLFASVARSYIYQYDDQTIYDILKEHDEAKIDEDPIMKDVRQFIEENKDVSAYEFFINMINFFGIVDKLCLVGDVDDNVSKIESLGAILASQEKMGDTLEDFVRFLKDINDYSLDLSGDTTIKVDNAVDMMTIHASKGLEGKIVYLPVSFNQLTQGNNAEKPDYIFDEKYGIILPYYNYDTEDVDEDGNIKDVVVDTLPSMLLKNSDKDPERDEHVRLFYVALTRAENIVYIVGDKPSGDNRKKETLYGMLSYLPHYQRIDEEYIARKIKEKQVDPVLYQQYLKTIEIIKNINLMSAEGMDADLYSKLFNKYYTDKLTKILEQQIYALFKPLFREFYLRFKNMTRDPLMDATFYGYYRYKKEFKSIEELEDTINEDANGTVDLNMTINDFVNAVISGNCAYFYSKTQAANMAKLTEEEIPYGLFDVLLPVFVRGFDCQKRFIFESYENKDYRDTTLIFEGEDEYEEEVDEEEYAEEVISKIDQLPVDDSVITFPTIIKERASKQRHYDEAVEDTIPDQVLTRGVYLHRLMELVDFVNKDTSFIENEKDRKLIDNVLSNPVFNDLGSAKIYKEYGYYDESLQTTGFIDLLYFKDDECYIVDYKSRSIDDEAYERQLRIYQRNVQLLFNINKEHMHLYLLSLIENRIKEVQPE